METVGEVVLASEGMRFVAAGFLENARKRRGDAFV